MFRRKDSGFWKPFSSCYDIFFNILGSVWGWEMYEIYASYWYRWQQISVEENSTLVRLTSGASSSSARFWGHFFSSELFCFTECHDITSAIPSPFLLLYLIFCCAPSLLNAFTVIHVDGSKEMCRSWAPSPLGTQVAWKSNPAVQQLYGALKDVSSRSDSLPASTATNTVMSLVPMSKAHRQYDSGKKVELPLKCSLNLVLSFSTAPFFPILHGTYCKRSNQGMKT